MALTLVTPRYQHRRISSDEQAAKAIADLTDPSTPLPQKCGGCGAVANSGNPLMMRPVFRMEHGGPKGTMYEARCSRCMEQDAQRRRGRWGLDPRMR